MSLVLARSGGTVSLPGTGRVIGRRAAAALGVVLATLLIGAAVLVVATFGGSFTNYVAVRAILPAGANAPQLGSPVEYLDVTVGHTASLGTPVGHGQVAVVLHLEPSKLAAVPASVRATVGPLSIFGNQYVDLEALSGTGGPAVAAGQTIGPIPAGPGASLQSTVADLYDVLSEIKPDQLEATLTSLADALQGQGHALGAALHAGSVYLQRMIPLLPTLEADLRELAPVAAGVKAATPDLLGVLSNLAVTGRTIVVDGADLRGLLHGGSVVAGQAAKLLSATSKPLETLLADSGPLLADVSANSHEVADVLTGLDRWSVAWTEAESQGPYLSVSSTVHVANAADLVLAGLGAPDPAALFAAGLGAGKVNPPTYTPADCPSYGPMKGTDCGGSSDTTSGGAAASVPASIGGAAELRAVSSVVAGLDGGAAPSSPAVATLLLGPVLAAATP